MSNSKEDEKNIRLSNESIYGIQCSQVLDNPAFKKAFLELKGGLLNEFETIDSSNVEDLQESHRMYKTLSSLEAYFEKHIARGVSASNRLNLSKSKDQ